MRRIRKAKLFVFLRRHRHEVFDKAFQQELANLYRPSKRGHPPIAPSQLALAVILQAYTGVSDDEVIEATLIVQTPRGQGLVWRWRSERMGVVLMKRSGNE